VRSGQVRVSDDVFEKNGQQIVFQRASLTPAGRSATGDIGAKIALLAEMTTKGGKKARSKSLTAKVKEKTQATTKERPARPISEPLVDAIRAWRLGIARDRRVPAFRILTDKSLVALVEKRPISLDELGEISGIGPKFTQSYGTQILAIVAKTD
jgi:DNA topoisomerase-3